MRYSDTSKTLIYILIILGGVLISTSFFREKIESKDDLRNINATLKSSALYVYKKRSRHGFSNSFTYSYYLSLYEYSNDFQVIGDIGKDFDKENFEKEVLTGDTLSILVSKGDFNKMNTKKVIMLFGISTKKTVYLDYSRSIERYNKRGTVLIGIVLLITGVFFLQRTKNGWF